MPGGLIQLSAIGKENLFLTINPQISYFRNVYKQYSNFSKITFNIDISYLDNNTSLFKEGTTARFKIPKNGDLIKDFYLKMKLPGLYADINEMYDVKWTDDVQFNIIDYISFSIGGREIQRFDSEYLYIYYKTKLNNLEYNNLEACLNQSDINKDKLDIYNNIGNYTNNNEESLYTVEINSTSYVTSGSLPTQYIKSKYYNNGYYKQPIDIILPIPVWFSEDPFPIMALSYMDIDVTIKLKSLNDLILIRKRKINTQLETKSLFIPSRQLEDEALLEGFLQGKSTLLLNVDGIYNTDIYTIPNNAAKVNSDVPEYVDFNLDGYLGPIPDTTQSTITSNVDTNDTRIINTSVYIKNISHFIDNLNNIFRIAKMTIDLNSTLEFVNDQINDSGIGYYVPPAFTSKFDSTTGTFKQSPYYFTYDTTNTSNVHEYRYSKAKINNSNVSEQLKKILKSVFPKLYVIDSEDNRWPDIIEVTEIDALGQIKTLNILSNQLPEGFIKNDNNSTYNIEVYGLNTQTLNIEFNLLALKDYKYDDTVYRGGVTKHTFNTTHKFAPLVDIKVKNKGKYYIGSPEIYLFGEGSNFDPYVEFQYIGGSRSIKKIDINGKSPLGFLYEPKIKYSSLTPNTVDLHPSLGVYTLWWYPFGLFRTLNDKYTNEELPETTHLSLNNQGTTIFNKNTSAELTIDENNIQTERIYRDRQLDDGMRQTNLGKPNIQIVDSIGKNAKVEVVISDKGVGTFKIINEGSGYTSNNASVNFNNSITNGSYITITSISVIDGKVKSVNIGNKGRNFEIGDKLNITGGDNNAYIEVTGLDNGVITDVQILNAGQNYTSNTSYTLTNEQSGEGAIFSVTLQQISQNNTIMNIVKSVDVIKSGKNYNKYDPEVLIINNDFDYNGYGAFMITKVEDGQITDISPLNDEDRGYNYDHVPYAVVLGSKAFLATITTFDSNGGIGYVRVEDSFRWPKNIIDTMFTELKNDGEDLDNVYSDRDLYVNNTDNSIRLLDDSKVQYYLEVIVKGPGKNARLAATKNDFELIDTSEGQYYKLNSLTIIKAGENYNNTTLEIVNKNIANTNASGARFNLTLDYRGRVSANIIESGVNYSIDDKFKVVGGKFNNNETPETAYITVKNINMDGGIISIQVDPGLGYMNTNKLGIRDFYYFYPRPILGINRIDVINGGSNLKENPKFYIEDPVYGNMSEISNENFTLNISNHSIVEYLETQIIAKDAFKASNINNFFLVQPNGSNLKLNFYKSLIENSTIVNSGFSYKVGNIVQLKLMHNFKGYKTKNNPDDAFIIGRFRVKSVGELGNVTEIEPFIENPLDFCSKYIDLYYKFNNTDTNSYISDNNNNDKLLFQYGSSTLNIINDDILPEFEFIINENKIITDIILINKGRNLTNSPVYNILDKFIKLDSVVSYDIPIVGVYDEENQNIKEIITYMGKNYQFDPEIRINNLGSNNLSDTGIIYTEQLKVQTGFLQEKLVYKFNVVSGNGYRHPPSITCPVPNLVSSNMRKAIIETKSIASLEHIDIIDGGTNFDSLEDFDWNSEDFDNEIIIQPVIYEGTIQNIIVVTSPTKFESDIEIKITHKRGLSTPVIVNSIMNFHVSEISIIDNGFGYSSSLTDDNGNEVILVEYDKPCPDNYGNNPVESFYPAKALMVIKDCRISNIYPISGSYNFGDNTNKPTSNEFKILIDIINESENTNEQMSLTAIEKSIQWVKVNDIWYIYDFVVSIDLGLPFLKKDDIPFGTVKYTELVSIDNEDALFSLGKRLSIKLYENEELQACDVDRTQFNYGFLKNDYVYIVDRDKYEDIVEYNKSYGLPEINIYDYKQLDNLNLIISNHKILYTQNQTIYNITYNSDTAYDYKEIVNSIDSYNNALLNNNANINTLKILINQQPDLVAEVYPFFENINYSEINWGNNGSDTKKIYSIEIINSSEYFENEGYVGYRGGGLFDASIIMEAGLIRFINSGNNYDYSKEPLYDVSPSYEIDKFTYYKNKYLETYDNYRKTNGGIEGDNNDNLILDTGETGGIEKFIDYYNKQIQLNTVQQYDTNTNSNINVLKLENNYKTELAAIFISTMQEGCEPERNLGAFRYIKDYRGYYFFSKPIILPNGSYNKYTKSSINVEPYRKIKNDRDYYLVFKNQISNYNLECIIDYIFIDDTELKKYLRFEQKFFITQYNKQIYKSISDDTDIDYNTFGSTKDLLIFAKRDDFNDRNQNFNFTKLDSKYQNINYKNYISNYFTQYAVSKEVALNNNISEFISENYDNTHILLDTLSNFLNTSPGSYTIINNIDDLYQENKGLGKIKYVSYDEGLSIKELTDIREFWSFRELQNIPIINTNNYSEFTPEIINSLEIKFNNMTREETKPLQYYNQVQPYYSYNSGLPGLLLYTFSFDTVDSKPTGTCNFSHINKAQLKFKINNKSKDDNGTDYKYNIYVYNRYYNVLVCKSGLAELMFFK